MYDLNEAKLTLNMELSGPGKTFESHLSKIIVLIKYLQWQMRNFYEINYFFVETALVIRINYTQKLSSIRSIFLHTYDTIILVASYFTFYFTND